MDKKYTFDEMSPEDLSRAILSCYARLGTDIIRVVEVTGDGGISVVAHRTSTGRNFRLGHRQLTELLDPESMLPEVRSGYVNTREYDDSPLQAVRLLRNVGGYTRGYAVRNVIVSKITSDFIGEIGRMRAIVSAFSGGNFAALSDVLSARHTCPVALTSTVVAKRDPSDGSVRLRYIGCPEFCFVYSPSEEQPLRCIAGNGATISPSSVRFNAARRWITGVIANASA
jgi:hypothetical protein